MKIETLIKHALTNMYNDQKNEHLLKHNVSERCLVAVFRDYFKCAFRRYYRGATKYNIDLEYNLNIDKQKNINLGFNSDDYIKKAKELGIKLPSENSEEIQGFLDSGTLTKLIYPDLIVHKRGTHHDNLVVIEFKKSTSNRNSKYDKFKLEKMLNDPFYYKKAFYVEFSTGINYNQRNNKIEEVTNRSTN